MTVRQISVSEFKAHCTEERREVEKGNVILQVTRHGKAVAVVGKLPEEPIADLLGVGKATATLDESYDPSPPTPAKRRDHEDPDPKRFPAMEWAWGHVRGVGRDRNVPTPHSTLP